MAELLGCPFCGGEAEIVQIGNEVTPKRGFEVRCLTWGCATKKRAMVIRQPLEKAHAFAIAAWNRRAAPARLPDSPSTTQDEPSLSTTKTTIGEADLLEALRPFARIADQYDEDADGGRVGDDFPGSEVLYGRRRPNLGDFRRARLVLAKALGPSAADPEPAPLPIQTGDQ